MGDPEATVAAIVPRDRSGLLIVFGVIEILIGLISILLTGLIVLGATVLSRMPPEKAPRMNLATATQGALLMVAMAIFFLCMGVATIKGRRWARSIMLVASWIWLLLGCFMMVVLVKQRQAVLGSDAASTANLPALTTALISSTTTVFLSILYVVLPLALVLFYQRSDVRETFERKDPKRRWTDACAQPVLALSLVLSGYSLCTLMLLKSSVYPIFGRVLTGTAATLVIVAHAVIYAWLARATYRCRMFGWWGALVFLAVIPAISFWGFGRLDPSEILEKMSVPADPAVKAMLPWAQSSAPFWSAAFTLGTVGYLLYVRKFFKSAR
jgi:hypothetical protein